MRFIQLKLILLALVTLCMACDKEEDKEECNLPSFTGISWTDVNGQQLSAADPDDWTIDDEWNLTESDLFDSALQTNCTPSFDYFISAFPNPVPEYNNGAVWVYIGKDSLTSSEIRIVDKNCNIIHSRNNEFAHNIVFNLTGHEGDTLRLYYKLIKDGCEYRGHGDIEVE